MASAGPTVSGWQSRSTRGLTTSCQNDNRIIRVGIVTVPKPGYPPLYMGSDAQSSWADWVFESSGNLVIEGPRCNAFVLRTLIPLFAECLQEM